MLLLIISEFLEVRWANDNEIRSKLEDLKDQQKAIQIIEVVIFIYRTRCI
jgi:hypothetical protein